MGSGLGQVTIKLGSDGWFYTNIGYRFHGIWRRYDKSNKAYKRN